MKKIMIVCPHEGGVEYHRLISPYGSLISLYDDIEIHQINGIKEDHDLTGIDLVVFNRELNTNGDLAKALTNIKRQCPLIVDIDDYWHLSERHILKKVWKDFNTSEKIQQCIKAADLVTCTHEVLAKMVRPINNNVHILPNCLNWHEDQWKTDHSSNPYITVGWAGGAAHLEDVELLLRSMKKLGDNMADMPQLSVSLCGYSDEEVWKKYEDIFTGKGKIKRLNRIGGLPVMEYGKLYNHMSMVMVPLASNLFNRCKSDLKLSEAGIKRKPVIVSKVHPYIEIGTDKNVLFASDSMDWYRHIKRLYKSEQMREDYGNALYETILEKRNYILIGQERRQIIDELWSNKPLPCSLRP